MRVVATLGLLAGMAALVVIACSPGGGGDGSTGDANKGKELFTSKQCITCHTLPSVTGATGVIGPKLDGIATTAATRKSGMSAAAYLRESIKEPNAFTVDGFAPNLMVLPVPVNDSEINDLVAFLLTQR